MIFLCKAVTEQIDAAYPDPIIVMQTIFHDVKVDLSVAHGFDHKTFDGVYNRNGTVQLYPVKRTFSYTADEGEL